MYSFDRWLRSFLQRNLRRGFVLCLGAFILASTLGTTGHVAAGASGSLAFSASADAIVSEREAGLESSDSSRSLPAGWERMHTRHLEIQFPPGQEYWARKLEDWGDQALEATGEKLELEPSRRYVVRVAGDRETFSSFQPARPPPWAAGTAYPGAGLMVLLTEPRVVLAQNLYKTFVHESVHLLLGELFREHDPPRWINEGMARLVAEEMALDEWTTLSRAVLLDRLFSFSELEERFPLGQAQAQLAYAQSRHFLQYLVRRFGIDILPLLTRRISKGDSLNEALWLTVQHGLTALEQDWQLELQRSYAWVSALFGGLSIWGIMALLLVIGYVRKKRQSRARRARWAEEEALLYGETEAWGDAPWRVGTDRFAGSI